MTELNAKIPAHLSLFPSHLLRSSGLHNVRRNSLLKKHTQHVVLSVNSLTRRVLSITGMKQMLL